ncbi:hypothetical protein A2U01_0065118, partial [Trifolium medium]|nr:hypothetical protein [Trifolium medium]
AQPDSKQEGK